MANTMSGAPDVLHPRVLVEAFYQAFGHNKFERLNEIVDENWEDVPLAPGQQPGREGLQALFASFHSAFSNVEVTVEQMLVEGDDVAVRVAIEAVQNGPFLGVSANGKRVRISAHDFHKIHNGLISRTDHLEDWFGWLFQVGAFPSHQEDIS